jgi:hypothetical protein
MGLQATVDVDPTEGIVDTLKGLTGKRYRFYWCESLGIVLDSYYELSRPSTRHKFRIDATWDRLNSRDNRIPKPDVDFCIVTETKRAIREQIQFKGGW